MPPVKDEKLELLARQFLDWSESPHAPRSFRHAFAYWCFSHEPKAGLGAFDRKRLWEKLYEIREEAA